MSDLTAREILIASTFSRVDIWKSQLEENGINVSEASMPVFNMTVFPLKLFCSI